ncbi:MlaD family protein [Hirschia baltica]|uniref:Mammalian cell entry related domain protein n=1 Tax=Hirschia baltica (strain ATCC 49814 / DSM 5838 / IFAM 1418) TaxID=582402 RepID=C6XN24_HIRBI|nr:MlaD family protein [Hirschia baltica]ACT58194.1 Mammalian cell entry related domain protein [Hirschia baltica ATCC 49814]
METRANYGLIGAFVLMAMVAFVLFAVWISKVQFSKEFSVFDVVFEGAVNGLSEGGEVRFNGIKVGEVTDLGLDAQDPNNVIARIRVDANTPVKSDSRAELGLLGITGMTFIQIKAGSPDEPLLNKGIRPYPPRIKTDKTQLDKIFSGGEGLIESSTDALDRVSRMFRDENVTRISNILANIEDLTDVANGQNGIAADAQRAIQALEGAGIAMNDAAVAVDAASVQFDANVALMTKDTMLLLKDMQNVVKSADHAVGSVEGVVMDELAPSAEEVMSELSTTLQDVQLLVQRLDGVVAELERDPREFVLGDVKPYE